MAASTNEDKVIVKRKFPYSITPVDEKVNSELLAYFTGNSYCIQKLFNSYANRQIFPSPKKELVQSAFVKLYS